MQSAPLRAKLSPASQAQPQALDRLHFHQALILLDRAIHSRYRHKLSQPIRLYLLTHTPASSATTTFYHIQTTRSPSAQSLLRSAEQLPPSRTRERALPVQQHLPSGARKRCPRAAQQHPLSDALRAPRQAYQRVERTRAGDASIALTPWPRAAPRWDPRRRRRGWTCCGPCA